MALANSDFETEIDPMNEDLPDPTKGNPSRSLARVFDIPELLHMIVSYLPISNLHKTRRVNRTFRHAVENSVALQQTLFQCPRKGLRTPPGQVWCRRRTPDPWDYYRYTVEQQSEQDSFGLGRRFEPRELCPLLTGVDHRTMFAMQPEEIPFWARTSLTNPPSYGAQLFLRYIHDLEPGITLEVNISMSQASPLTMGTLLRTARQRHGLVRFEETPNPGPYIGPHVSFRHDTCLNKELAEKQKKRGGRFKIDLTRSTIHFYQCDIVTAQVWEELRRNREAIFTLPAIEYR